MSQVLETHDPLAGAGSLAALRDRWRLIAVFTLIAVIAAGAYSLVATPRFEAEADVLITPIPGNDTTFLGMGLLRESSDQSRGVLTAARLVRTPEVAKRVAADVGSTSPERLLDSIEVTPIGQSNILSITGTGTTPEAAIAIANGFASAVVNYRSELFQTELESTISRLEAIVSGISTDVPGSTDATTVRQQLTSLRALRGAPDPTLTIASRAEPPATKVWPRPKLALAVTGIVGLLLGATLVLLLDRLSASFSREDDLLAAYRLPVLARIPRLKNGILRRYLSGRVTLPAANREAYRILRTTLSKSGTTGGLPGSIVVVSPGRGEGKTFTALNFAVAIAYSGSRVILVDANLRAPAVGTMLGIRTPPGSGFADLLAGRASLAQVLTPMPGTGGNVRLILGSRSEGRLVDLLNPRRLRTVFAQMEHVADVVVVDCPALGETADALALAAAGQSVIVAARLGRTRKAELLELRRLVEQAGIEPLGFVLTERRVSRHEAVPGLIFDGMARPTERARPTAPAPAPAPPAERRVPTPARPAAPRRPATPTRQSAAAPRRPLIDPNAVVGATRTALASRPPRRGVEE